MNDARWIGRQGEKSFSLLCSKRSVTCNKADEDDLGWDYILQFPPPSLVHLPIDQRSGGVTALVQVKATGVGARRWSVSLKNALALITSPLPAFIICVDFDAAGQETYRAINLWRDDIARVLMAARRAHVAGDEVINRRAISFRFDEDTRRADVLGWMGDEIGRIGEANYASTKRLMVDTLGFEDGVGIIRMQFSSTSPMALADLQLGLIDGLEVDRFSYTPRRFGIEAPTPEIDCTGGRIEILPQGRRGTLRLRAPDGHQAFIPAEVFSAVLPGQRPKVRIKAGFIDILLSASGRFTVKCREDRDRIVTLDDIAGLALLRRSTRETKLTMSFKTDRTWDDLGYVNHAGLSKHAWDRLFLATQALTQVAVFENVDPVATSVNALNSQLYPLSVLVALVSSQQLRIAFTPHGEKQGEVGALLAHASVRLGEATVGAVASRPVFNDIMIGNRRRIDFGPATLLHCATDEAGVRALPDLYMDELDRMSEHVDVLAIGDLRRAAQAGGNRELMVDAPRRTPARLAQLNGQ